MQFSVVIPTFNRLPLLQQTLASVWAQRYTDFETVVVDDGSTDGTSEWLQAHAPAVRVIRGEHRGPGAARNLGIGASQADYVVFLDSDDLWFPWTLSALSSTISQTGAAVVALSYLEFSTERDLDGCHESPVRCDRYRDFLASSAKPISAGSGTIALRRDVLSGVRFTEDAINAEDHDFMLQLGVAPGFVQILEPVMLGWRRHDASLTASLERSLSGMFHLVAQERSGRFPGGRSRAAERRTIITRHLRPITLAALKAGRVRPAWQLFVDTLAWQIAGHRWSYLAAFPALALAAAVRPSRAVR